MDKVCFVGVSCRRAAAKTLMVNQWFFVSFAFLMILWHSYFWSISFCNGSFTFPVCILSSIAWTPRSRSPGRGDPSPPTHRTNTYNICHMLESLVLPQAFFCYLLISPKRVAIQGNCDRDKHRQKKRKRTKQTIWA